MGTVRVRLSAPRSFKGRSSRITYARTRADYHSYPSEKNRTRISVLEMLYISPLSWSSCVRTRLARIGVGDNGKGSALEDFALSRLYCPGYTCVRMEGIFILAGKGHQSASRTCYTPSISKACVGASFSKVSEAWECRDRDSEIGAVLNGMKPCTQ